MKKHRTVSVGAALIGIALVALTGTSGAAPAARPPAAPIALAALTGTSGAAPAALTPAAAPVCRTWTAQPNTEALPPSVYYDEGRQGLAVLSPSDIWTVGTVSNAASGAQIHHWDGTTWANVPLPPPRPNFNNTLSAITAVAPNDIWAVGSQVLHWDGSQWQTVAAPIGSAGVLSAVAASGPDNVWAVGQYSEAALPIPPTATAPALPTVDPYPNAAIPEPLAIHWDGRRWNRVAMPTIHSRRMGRGLEGVAVLSADNVWAVGTSDGEEALLIHWDGHAWGRVNPPTPPAVGSALHVITALAPNDIWAVGEEGNPSTFMPSPVPDIPYRTLVLHWDGQTWSRTLPPTFQDQHNPTGAVQITSVIARNPQDVWLVAKGNQVVLAHWTGNGWARSRTPLPNVHWARGWQMVAAGGDLWALGSTTDLNPTHQNLILRYSAGPCTANRTFPETGHTVADPLLAYWEEHGALAQQGFPLTEIHAETSPTDGKMYQTQYFERAVFEQHPENAPPYDILLSLLGVEAYNQRYGTAGAPGQQVNNDRARFFSETGHTVGGDFRLYWEAHSGLAQQGYPISEEFQERNALNGQTYTVQYFQRAVFEYHPENRGTPYVVLLSQLGRFAAQRRGLLAP